MTPEQAHQQIQKELQSFLEILLNEPISEDFPLQVRCVLAAIHRHLFKPELNVKWALAACNIRSNSFRDEFKFYCQTTMRRYIEDKRMLAAMLLLGMEDLDVTLIAMSIGYTSHRSFARAFKRYIGCAASEYRESVLTQFGLGDEGAAL